MRQPIRRRVAEANNIDQKKYIHTLLVDGNNMLRISLVNHRINEVGKDCGAVVTFLHLLGEILAKKDFDYCNVVFDGEQSGILRYNFYKDYKANRDKNYGSHANETDYDKAINAYVKKVLKYSRENKSSKTEETEDESFQRQKNIINLILEELCIRQYEYNSVEGDDIISHYVHNKKDNEKVVIVSSDKDLTQLISDTVIVYNPRKKEFINRANCVEKIGIRSDNVVLEKILCGDTSDNIKGVKGVGEKTLVTLFPQLLTEKLELKDIMELSQGLIDRRKEEKKKPLKSLENIINGVTDGSQGDKLYEVNEKIIDLSKPLLTEEAENDLKDILYTPLDTDERDVKNIYKIINEFKINDLMNEDRFGEIFAPYYRIINMEKKRYGEFKRQIK